MKKSGLLLMGKAFSDGHICGHLRRSTSQVDKKLACINKK